MVCRVVQRAGPGSRPLKTVPKLEMLSDEPITDL
jgi:hypothetical protein